MRLSQTYWESLSLLLCPIFPDLWHDLQCLHGSLTRLATFSCWEFVVTLLGISGLGLATIGLA